MVYQYSGKPCRFGIHCRNHECLFFHPNDGYDNCTSQQETPPPSAPSVEDRLAKQNAQNQQYELQMQQLKDRLENPDAKHASVQISEPIPDPYDTFVQEEDDGSNYYLSENLNPSEFYPTWTEARKDLWDTSYSTPSDIGTWNSNAFLSTVTETTDFEFPSLLQSLTLEPSSFQANEESQTMADRVKNTTKVSEVAATRQEKAKIQIIKMPQELWVDTLSRNSNAYSISDPMERFSLVNSKNKHSGVIDLHFQTSTTVDQVLAQVLCTTAFYRVDVPNREGYVWIITGTGHHTTQRLHRVFDVVQEYLDQHQYYYKIGKDSNGHHGAFFVKIVR